MTKAMREQRQVTFMVPAEVVDEQVWRREDRDEEPDDERHDEERDDEDEREDRQRRAYQEPNEHGADDLDCPQCVGGCDSYQRRVFLEDLGVRRGRVGARGARGGEWLGSSHVASFVHAPSSSRPYGSRVNPLVDV
jgi:hypothetical protein